MWREVLRRVLAATTALALSAAALYGLLIVLFVGAVSSEAPDALIPDGDPFGGAPDSWGEVALGVAITLGLILLDGLLISGAVALIAWSVTTRWPRWKRLCFIPATGCFLGVVVFAVILIPKLDEGQATAAYNLGARLEKQGDLKGAVAAYRRGDERGHGGAAHNLGVLLEKQGDLKGAEAAYRRGDEVGDDKAAYHLGELLRERGDLKGAKDAFARARGRARARGCTFRRGLRVRIGRDVSRAQVTVVKGVRFSGATPILKQTISSPNSSELVSFNGLAKGTYGVRLVTTKARIDTIREFVVRKCRSAGISRTTSPDLAAIG